MKPKIQVLAIMMADNLRKPIAALGLVLLICVPRVSMASPPNFQDDVQPVFRKHCVACHNADESESGLDLSTSKTTVAGSSGGNVVVAGRPDTSSLYLAITHHEDHAAMPPNKPQLSGNDLKIVRDWIAGGLVARAGGKSQLREVSFEVQGGSMKRPDVPALPSNLPYVPVADTNTAPPILALACSPWANLIAVSGHRQVLLYQTTLDSSGGKTHDLQDARVLQVDPRKQNGLKHVGALPFPEGEIHDLRFSRNGDLLICAGGVGAESGKVVVFDVKTGRRVAVLGDEYDVVLSADISPDHEYVALGTTARMVKVFSARNGKLLHRIKKHTDWVTVVRFSPDGKQLATGDRNGGIHVWESESGGIVYTLDEHKLKVTALSWRPDGNLLASAAEDGKLVLWDMNDGWATRSITAHAQKAPSRYSRRTGTLDVAFATDGRLVTVGRDRTARLWKPDGTRTSTLGTIDSLPLQAKFSADQQKVVVGTFGGQLKTYPVPASSGP